MNVLQHSPASPVESESQRPVSPARDPLPPDWRQVSLWDLAAVGMISLQNGFPCGKHNDLGVGIPQLRPMNVSENGQIVLDRLKYVEPGHDVSRYLIKAGDVIFNNTNSEELVGKTAFWDRNGNFVPSNHMTIVRVLEPEKLDSFYLSRLLHKLWFDGYYYRICRRHVNQASVSLERLKQIVLPLPPIHEQRRIARVLSAIQRAIEAQQKVIAAARELKRSLMEHLFTYGPVPVTEASRVPLKETEIGPVPGHWEVARLGDYAERVTKGSSPNWQGFQYVRDGITFLRSQNVGMGRLDLEDITYLPQSFNAKEKRSIVMSGDLLINIVGASIGRAAVAGRQVSGANINQAVALVRLRDELHPHFVMTFLLTPAGQFQLHRQKKDIARANLSLQDLSNLLVPLAPQGDQERAVDLLEGVQRKLESEEWRKVALQVLFKSMLHHLMTGKIRVPESVMKREPWSGFDAEISVGGDS